MYRGFNVNNIVLDSTQFYIEGLAVYDEQKKTVRKAIDAYISLDGTLNGTKLQNEWFPQIEADVFISHSHADERLAITFAGFLHHHFQLNCFVDSCVWGYANELLKNIDNKYCSTNAECTSYSYELRNYSTSHVHMMLNAALTKLIDKTECLFFINTPQSISSKETVREKTNSPWIYSELIISQLIRKKRLKEYRPYKDITKAFSRGGQIMNEARFNVEYDVYLGHLTTIQGNDIAKWYTTYVSEISKKSQYPLDRLYGMFP